MDVDLKLPPGDVNEWALRELRTRVPKEACADAIELARQEVGSYREITAQSIVSAAEQLGCLKPPTTKATASRGNQATADQCEEPPPPVVGGPPRRIEWRGSLRGYTN